MKAQDVLWRRSWKPGQVSLQRIRWRERERERKTRGPKSLEEQGCFNDLFVSMYRLLCKEFLSTMIKIRKPNVQQPVSRKQGISNGHKVRRQSISQERESWLSSFVVRRLFTEGNPCMYLSHVLIPGSSMSLHLFPLSGTDKEQRIYEIQETARRNLPVKHFLTLCYMYVIFFYL